MNELNAEDEGQMEERVNAGIRWTCYSCFKVEVKKGYSREEAQKNCQSLCSKREIADDQDLDDSDEEQLEERKFVPRRRCLDCINGERRQGSTYLEANRYCRSVCSKREVDERAIGRLFRLKQRHGKAN